MLNKILKRFGLVTIKQAKHINRETVALLHRSVAKMANTDFGAPINSQTEEFNRQWADECFDEIINHRHSEEKLMGAWEIWDI